MDLRRAATTLAIGALLAAACGLQDDPGFIGSSEVASAPRSAGSSDVTGQRHPDIVDVEITPAGEGTFDLAVTVSSPYDTPDRYADGWRVLTPGGTELATHTLMHDHAGEQPFTRTQAGLAIPADVDEVVVEGRDQQYGFGGGTVTVQVPHGGR